jgi:outer membrane lipoprotein-sorting protein
MRPNNNIPKLIADLKIKPSTELDSRVNSAIDAALAERKRIESTQENLGIGRIIMRSPITKLAVAAVIVIAILTGIYFITGKIPAVTCCAWAQIADKVQQIKTCICKMHVKTSVPQGQTEQQGEMFISAEHGFRMDTYMDGKLAMQMFMKLDEKKMVTVMPSQKKYMRIELTDEKYAETKKKVLDPRDMVGGFMTGQYKELGSDTIDGIEVKGIEVVNPPMFKGIYNNFIGRMWVDVKTEYPVKIEIEAEVAAGTQKVQLSMVMDEFEWGIELGPEEFEPNIPADYTTMGELKMPAQDETSAIEGLHLFAEMTGGKYPSQMNMMTVMQETQEALKEKLGIEPNKEPGQEETQQMMGKIINVQATFMFYNKLVQDGKDAAYYGKDVTAGDTDAILMRWKISDDTYRVIYGDLTAEDVNAEELKELEQPAQQ